MSHSLPQIRSGWVPAMQTQCGSLLSPWFSQPLVIRFTPSPHHTSPPALSPSFPAPTCLPSFPSSLGLPVYIPLLCPPVLPPFPHSLALLPSMAVTTLPCYVHPPTQPPTLPLHSQPPSFPCHACLPFLPPMTCPPILLPLLHPSFLSSCSPVLSLAVLALLPSLLPLPCLPTLSHCPPTSAGTAAHWVYPPCLVEEVAPTQLATQVMVSWITVLFSECWHILPIHVNVAVRSRDMGSEEGARKEGS